MKGIGAYIALLLAIVLLAQPMAKGEVDTAGTSEIDTVSTEQVIYDTVD